MQESLILVNEQDEQVGTAEKLLAHRRGLLHRAFSVFIFNSAGEVLLQKRAYTKYHSGGLFTNACCGHPRDGESVAQAAKRRLYEETGASCDLREVGSFIYQVAFANGMQEHEFDHVFVGEHDGGLKINKEEIEDYVWVGQKELFDAVRRNPTKYTYWLREAFDIARKGYHAERLRNTLKRPFSELLLTYKPLFGRMFLP